MRLEHLLSGESGVFDAARPKLYAEVSGQKGTPPFWSCCTVVTTDFVGLRFPRAFARLRSVRFLLFFRVFRMFSFGELGG